MSQQINVVSVSGGKDSLATALVCIAQYPVEQIRLVHADTGHEHPHTVEYLNYLEDALGMRIVRLRADFRAQIRRKRQYVLTQWPLHGVPDEVVREAADVLSEPTGIPFLDLCLWKGRFPSRLAQFCTTELKSMVIGAYQLDLVDVGYWVWSWQGVRRDESPRRANLHEWEDLGGGIGIYRPILRWRAADVFEASRYVGIDDNPLYRLGARRVGCMPCINSGKDEIRNIASRWPEVIKRIRRWEVLVSRASKRGGATLFHCGVGRPPCSADAEAVAQHYSIDSVVRWAQTSHGGRQFDLTRHIDLPAPACSSVYGLCE